MAKSKIIYHGERQIPLLVEKGEDGFFVASVPSLPGCYTQAKTVKELKKRVREAISLCLETAQIDPQYRRRLKLFAYEPNFLGLDLVTV